MPATTSIYTTTVWQISFKFHMLSNFRFPNCRGRGCTSVGKLRLAVFGRLAVAAVIGNGRDAVAHSHPTRTRSDMEKKNTLPSRF